MEIFINIAWFFFYGIVAELAIVFHFHFSENASTVRADGFYAQREYFGYFFK